MSNATKYRIAFILLPLVVIIFHINVIAQEAKFQQSSEDDGLVCMEAENYSIIKESATDTYWEFVEELLDFSGIGAM